MRPMSRSHALPLTALATFALLLVAIPRPTRAQIVGET